MFARRAVLARVAREPGIDHDAIARRHVRHVAPGAFDDAGGVAAEDPGRNDRHAGEPLHDEEIEMIERGGGDPDAHVAGRTRISGIGTIVAEVDLLEIRRVRK